MSVLTIPNVYMPGEEGTAAVFNQNFTAVEAAVNNIDATNIGAVGLYASNLLPTTNTEATFGGSAIEYTFPNALVVTEGFSAGGAAFAVSGSGVLTAPSAVFANSVQSSSDGAVTGTVPPVYSPNGNGVAATAHLLLANITISVGSGVTVATGTVNLAGAANFTSANSYIVIPSFASSPSFPTGWNIGTTGIFITYGATSFTIELASSTTSTGTGSVVVGYIVLGS